MTAKGNTALRSWLALAVAVSLTAQAQQGKTDTLTSVSAGGWDTGFDPAYCYSAGCAWILNNTSEALFKHNAEDVSVIEPLLVAQMPSVANGGISKDGKTYTLKLRPGLRFSDGTPLTADDVAYTIKRMLVYAADAGPSSLLTEPLLGSPDLVTAKTSFAAIDKAVQAKGKDTVVFTIARPFAPFLSILAFPAFGIMEKAAAVKAGDWSGTARDWQKFVGLDVAQSLYAKTGPMGSAPFLIERYDPEKLVVLKRNDNYWRTPAKFSRVIVQNVDDDTTRLQLLKAGDADMAERSAVPGALVPQLTALPNISVDSIAPNGSLYGLFFTFKLTPSDLTGSGKLDGKGIPTNFFADKDVRTGFAYAFDYQGYIKEVLQGRAVQTSTVNVPGLLGYSKDNPKYTFDKAKATAAFKKAFGGQVWDKGFTMVVAARAGASERLRMLDVIKRGVESINPKFKIEVREMQGSQLNTLLADHKVPLLSGAWGVDYSDPHNMFQPLVASDGFYGTRTLYKNAAVDKAIGQAIEQTDPAKRARMYQALGKLVFNDVGMIPVYSATNIRVQNKWITNRSDGDEYYYSIVKK